MFLHELLEHFLLLGLLTRRFPHLLLPLIIHHFLNHTPRLPVQITQFAVLRHDLRHIDLWSIGRYMGPPGLRGGFRDCEDYLFADGCGVKCPGAVIGLEGMGCWTLEEVSISIYRLTRPQGLAQLTLMIASCPFTCTFM